MDSTSRTSGRPLWDEAVRPPRCRRAWPGSTDAGWAVTCAGWIARACGCRNATLLAAAVGVSAIAANAPAVLLPVRSGPPGTSATYAHEPEGDLRGTVVRHFTLALGAVESGSAGTRQWVELQATKADGGRFGVWIQCAVGPAGEVELQPESVFRYVVKEGEGAPQEFVHRITGEAVLPTLAPWGVLWPSGDGFGPANGPPGAVATWLGHRYRLEAVSTNAPPVVPPTDVARRLALLPDRLIGVPSNTRTRDDRRRWDGSDYDRVPLTRDDYAAMIEAGMNCFRVDAVQAAWLRDRPVFVWGIGGADVPFPECLFRPTYLGPALFFDEPAVGTRDHVLRPRLEKDAAFRRAITPQVALEAFREHFRHAVHEGAPTAFLKGLRARPDVDLGTLGFAQQNLYSWETMIASAAWQLTAEPDGGPRAIVFEPPGRLGSRRTLPEMNMAYGCQLQPGNPAHLAGILCGFLRGAARAAGKDWGISIYGAVDRSDAPWLLTQAYDLGATHFFFWDNYQLACVPFGECLALARHLQAHADAHPRRDLARLKRVAQVAILIPPGYDLGHTHMGRGNLWGLGELNLERVNRRGVTHRKVMAAAFTELERCLRLGIAFDCLWDLPGLPLDGYREVVRVREDARVEVMSRGRRAVRSGPRVPERADGAGPELTVLECGLIGLGPTATVKAVARVVEGDAPVYYTTGTDREGLYPNVRVLWELYGPGEEDYRSILATHIEVDPRRPGEAIVEIRFQLDRPGRHRLRVATTDLAGRSTVVWQPVRGWRE